MKKSVLILFLFTILGCYSQKDLNKDKYTEDEFLVTKIDSLSDFYVIYAYNINNNLKYKIISKNDKSYNCDKQIEIDKKYLFKTTSIFTLKINDNGIIREISNNINIKCIQIDDVKFCKDYDNGIYDILETKNLNGLCYIKD